MNDQKQYELACQIVRDAGKPGLSMLMRGLNVGFNTAARLMDQMEQAGIISKMQPSGERHLIKKEKQ
jgi:S-DNA-T family DNA segregation ATPase FtsK/SpoIIIE